MSSTVAAGIMLPFFGTAFGSAAVFLMKRNRRAALEDCLCGFAGGVMLAASVWSLLLPAIEASEGFGSLSFLPSAAGFFTGIIFMLLSEKIILRLLRNPQTERKRAITVFAVTLHNFPEGMAVGLVFAALASCPDSVSLAAAFSLSMGIAIQNIPEGAIVSLPLLSEKRGKLRAFFSGVLSGVVEPVGAVLTFFFARFFTPLMPLFLSFAAGAMIYVVMNELSQKKEDEKSSRRMLFFALGFVIMMSLDVALG